jgi:DNA (cytosine-5)-methyltransferase 1
VNAWTPGWEDGIPRVAVGVPDRVNKLRALGNALVPQIAEWIGRRILEHEEGRVAA